MDGKNSMKKSMRHLRHVQASRRNPYRGPYMEVGSWRFQENESGDLVITNSDTEQVVIFVKKEPGKDGPDG